MLPKHHETSFFLKSGLFDNLSDFAELEDRISKLPTTLEKGDAFEVFAEAYFFTQKIEQAEEVWPFKSVPSSIRENLSLGTNQQDMGVDGVYKTTSGQFNAYQAKFRTGRPSLTWREISTFMGLTDNVNQRVLFTNCNDMPSVINDRTGFHCIRGNDLDRLNKSDFETILKWLQSGEIEAERKTPLPHQRNALEDILNAFEEEDRATALMACGTGKTLVALWATEQMKCQNVLVLLPSLTLVRQTLHEWLKETAWPHLSYLCICSDPTVAGKELDSIKINQSDLDFAVTTDITTVKQFLSQDPGGVKIVFSTYQSSNIVAEAMGNNYCFDLGIFDEAHKTTGRTEKKFGFALKDENLNIQKRLFLTATPRHYNLNKRNKEGDFDLAYSMDNTDVYGKIAHQLSFAVAARQNIICNYKVIISVVTSEQVNKEMLKRGEVLIDGDIVNAQQVAHQIAFKEAINKYDIKRVFTFHKSVKSAKIFTGRSSEGIRTHLPEFNTFHVNGKMSTAERESVMNEFKNSDSSVISNARCLTEGVDLPAVDMVAFVSPKKSKVDIVQATGRAMRKDPHNPDKTHGYILVPLYLETTTGESIENAVDEADFGEVWDILQALQEQDDVLTDIIKQMQEEKGRYGQYKSDRLGDIVDILGVDISLKTLQESITSICIDKLGFTWDMRYGELINYKSKHGNFSITKYHPDHSHLYNWVRVQRAAYKNYSMAKDKIKRLEDIGFVWDALDSRWEEMIEALKQYKDKHGDCNVPNKSSDHKYLYNWIRSRRSAYRNQTINEDEIERLDAIGFVWDALDSRWEEMIEALKQYKDKHGDCNVPNKYPDNTKLANWVRSKRERYRNDTLDKDQISQLEDIGFKWNTLDSTWGLMIEELKEYKCIHGDCNVPYNWKNNISLARWLRNQRRNYRNHMLKIDQINQLEDIGFVWDALDSRWEEMIEALKQYKDKHGDCNVPNKYPDNTQLAAWVRKQRLNYNEQRLTKDEIERLEDIGFIWDVLDLKWEGMFEELKEYKSKHGDCNVPNKYTDNKQLATWVGYQRMVYKDKILGKERIKRLEDIGFDWNPSKSRWEEMFKALKEYKDKYGNYNIPRDWKENTKLANWIHTQRTYYKNGQLSNHQIKCLSDIGFVMTVSRPEWEETYEELKEYKNRHGDCNVSQTRPDNKQLGVWVNTQRVNYKRKKLSSERVKLLEDLGFMWNIHKRQDA
jgi:superfamily II DNA or RNA helicase